MNPADPNLAKVVSIAQPHFGNVLPGMFLSGETASERAAVVAARLERIAGAG